MPAAKRKTARRTRGKLAPARDRRGLAPAEIALPLDQPEVAELVQQIEAAGGGALGAYSARSWSGSPTGRRRRPTRLRQ